MIYVLIFYGEVTELAQSYSDEWYAEVAAISEARVVEGERRWANLIKSIFPHPVDEVTWTDCNQITDILERIGRVDNTNHVFRPRGGGFDLTGAGRAGELGCIELLNGGGVATIIKPRKLSFHAFGSDPRWYYFRLECRPLQPSGIYEVEEENAKSEELCELSPGEYVERSVWDEGYYGTDEDGYLMSLPDEARPIIREFEGSFVIFGKYSPYNQDSSTYDGRHSRGTSEQFANYIRKHTDANPAAVDY
jgi:serine/threonine-protein kinase